jgi:hypothetical protein
MIISIAVAKAFDKIQHPFLIKASMKLGLEGMYLNIKKAIYDKPTVNSTLNGEKTETISSKVRNESMVFTLSTLIQHSSFIFNIVLEFLARARNKKEFK